MNDMIMWSPGVTLESIERQVIEKALAFFKGNKTATAAALGVSVRTIDNKLEGYARADQAAKDAEHERRDEAEYQLKRARGQLTPDDVTARASRQAHARVGVESIANATAQHPVSVSERSQVQAVLPKQIAAGGSGKRR